MNHLKFVHQRMSSAPPPQPPLSSSAYETKYNITYVATGPEAHEIIGVNDKRERSTLPDLSGTPWKYVFIQSTSQIQMLQEGSHFMLCKININ